VIATQTGRPITIYGNGKQVRDMLYIDDLIDLYETALNQIDRAAGRIYNVGGGPENVLSIWAEFEPLLSRFAGKPVTAAAYGDWRPGDQPVCILDIRKAAAELGWQPKVGVAEGMERLYRWVEANISLFQE
jgi:CDP-paratose 2-epimerase